MAQFTPLDRLRKLLYPLVQQNDVSDAMLTGPAVELGILGAAADLMEFDGRFVDPNTVTIGSDLVTLTQVADVDHLNGNTPVYADLVDWTTRYRVGDEIILGGSTKGNNGAHTIQSVSASQMALAAPCEAQEAGLVYGKPTYALLALCRELMLYPGGWETDTQLRAFLASWIQVMQKRGSRSGIVSEMNRVANSSSTTLLETMPALITLQTGVSYTASSQSVMGNGWQTSAVPGTSITIGGSTIGSNGRYAVYSVSGTAVVLGHRAKNAIKFPDLPPVNGCELQFREDRYQNRVWVRLINTSSSSKTVAFTVTVANATLGTVASPIGVGSASNTSSVATISLTAASGGSSTTYLPLTLTTTPATFTVAITSGSPDAVRLGLMGLCPMMTDGTPSLSALWPWAWGGVVQTGLRSGLNETGLTIYASARPGWYLGVSTPGSVEEDAYTLASPDDFVVVEVDHRNYSNYSENDLATLVTGVLLPADVDGVLQIL